MTVANDQGSAIDHRQPKPICKPATLKRTVAAYAPVIPLIVERRNRGVTFSDIATMLNDSGYRTKHGFLFGPSTIFRILKLIGYSDAT